MPSDLSCPRDVRLRWSRFAAKYVFVFFDRCLQAYLCGPPAFTASTLELLKQVCLQFSRNIESFEHFPHFLPRWDWSRTTFSTSASVLKPRKRQIAKSDLRDLDIN